ncbi:YeeE/YedE family protein [Pyxidicoccus xibeiensis]|uniref:YeeE/YedE family protein n=1 Tax=Pyxidicoccus xibeiensis TaxID=2906759 RepID=UPI0020A82D40|nr:YeeE/YedE thiosulfate transporter family protein [Pyxidicoccus xibeiensis]MCP3142841.1 YeeE/YedE family protein [Pyxidicoccus xibeiensis]
MNAVLLPLLGGVLIGLSASLLLLFNGRIAGISGIVGGLFTPSRQEVGWRVAFLAGLLLGGALLAVFMPGALGAPVAAGVGVPLLSGLLIGLGARLGSGCTSGHGICGIARGATRSIVATATFIATGVLTVFVVRHLLGGVS